MDQLTNDLLELFKQEKKKYKRIKEDAIDISQYYTEREIELLTNYGFVPVTIGKRILRAETAAIAATTFTQRMKLKRSSSI